MSYNDIIDNEEPKRPLVTAVLNVQIKEIKVNRDNFYLRFSVILNDRILPCTEYDSGHGYKDNLKEFEKVLMDYYAVEIAIEQALYWIQNTPRQ